MLDSLHYEAYAPHLNSKFQLTARGQSWELELIAVEDKSPSPRQEQFVLLFRAPLDAPPYQSIFQLEHAVLGAGALFLVPIKRDQQGVCYEATFNRVR
jgi:hypothetical protein